MGLLYPDVAIPAYQGSAYGRKAIAIRIRNRLRGLSLQWRLTILIAIFLTTTQLASAQLLLTGRETAHIQPDYSDQPKDAGPYELFTPLRLQTQEDPYEPITPRQRVRWFIANTVGPPHLIGGMFAAGFGTALDRPREYGPHWGGFADRYGIRMTGIVTGNAIEAGVGYLIGEDPRYFRVQDSPFKARIGNVVRLTFFARHPDGTYGPAYARFLAISGNNFLSNTWRVHSEANARDALFRTAEGFAGRLAVNAFEEFWPDIKKRILLRRD